MIAAIMQLLPADVQDTAFPRTGTASTYEVRGTVKGLVCNSMGGEQVVVQEEDDSWLLGAVGKGVVCHARGDCGFYARECRYLAQTSSLVTGKSKGKARSKGDDQGRKTLFFAQAQSKGGCKGGNRKCCGKNRFRGQCYGCGHTGSFAGSGSVAMCLLIFVARVLDVGFSWPRIRRL